MVSQNLSDPSVSPHLRGDGGLKNAEYVESLDLQE